MRVHQRLRALVLLSISMLIGTPVIPGCSGDRMKTGTVVERTPEQEAAEKESMEGMKKAMMKAQGQGKEQPR